MTTMRFRQVFVALMLMVAVLGLAGVARGTNHTFTFTSPTGSTVWQAGTTVTIQWTGGSPYPTVYLSLIDVPNWVVAEVITTSTANTGSYEWTIPCTVPGGTYEVYIQDTSGPTEWKYSDDFTILGCKDPTDPKEQPDLAIEKKPDGELVAGQNAIYQIVVSNVGTAPAPGPIVVTDSVGAGLTFLSAAGSGWTCSPSTGPVPGPTTVTCTHPGPLAAGGSLPPIALAVAVAEGVDQVENCAGVMMEGADPTLPGDPNPDNDKSCVTTTVVQPKPGTVCGVKFHDVNGNGVRDTGEPGLPGWTIEIKDMAGNVVGTVTTGLQGRYCIEVKPGTYVVFEVQQSGWTQTAPATPGTHTVTVASGQTVSGILFGNTKKKPCCLDFTFPAGKADNFSASDGLEPASPPPGKPPTYFDQTEVNKAFYHRFVLPQGNCVREATLEVRVKPLGDISPNDSITLYSGTMSQWGAHFGAGYPGTALLPNPWTVSNYGAGQTLTLNLASLPGGGNLIPALHNSRYLDVAIQDDTSIDHMILKVKFCECKVVADMQEPVTVTLTARLDGTTDPAGPPVLYKDDTLYAPAEAFAEPLGLVTAACCPGEPQVKFIVKKISMDDSWNNDPYAEDAVRMIEFAVGSPEAMLIPGELHRAPGVSPGSITIDEPGTPRRCVKRDQNGKCIEWAAIVMIDPANPAVMPFLQDGRVMLPVGFIAQTFGMIYNITVNEEGVRASITVNENDPIPLGHAINEKGLPGGCSKGYHWDPKNRDCVKDAPVTH